MLEESVGFEPGWNELRSLVGIFGGDVVANSTALIQNEAIVILITKEKVDTEDRISKRRLTR